MDENTVIVEDAELVLGFFLGEGVLKGVVTAKGKCVGRRRGQRL